MGIGAHTFFPVVRRETGEPERVGWGKGCHARNPNQKKQFVEKNQGELRGGLAMLCLGAAAVKAQGGKGIGRLASGG